MPAHSGEQFFQTYLLNDLAHHPFARSDIFTEEFSRLSHYKDNETLYPASISPSERHDLDADGSHFIVKTTVTPSLKKTKQAHSSDSKKLVLVCVHGTWSTHTAYAVKLEHEILSFASLLAATYERPVELVYYQWSGAPNRDNRKMAGILLSNVLINEYPDATIWTLAHSHGCSVVHHTSAMLAKKGRSIDTAIHLCAPDLDIKADDVAIKRIFSFYGTRDMVQVAGSALNKMSLCRIVHHDHKRANRVYNIRVQNDGVNPDHFNIKLPLIKNLAWMISIIDTFYPTYGYFDANIYPDTKAPIIAIRNTLHRNETIEPVTSSLDFSREQEAAFLKLYHRSIHSEHDNTFKGAVGEWAAKLVSDLNHKRRDIWQKWRAKKDPAPTAQI